MTSHISPGLGWRCSWSRSFGVGHSVLGPALDSLPLRDPAPSPQTKPPRSLILQRPPVGTCSMSGEKASGLGWPDVQCVAPGWILDLCPSSSPSSHPLCDIKLQMNTDRQTDTEGSPMLNRLCSANFPNDFGTFPAHGPALSQDTLLTSMLQVVTVCPQAFAGLMKGEEPTQQGNEFQDRVTSG